MNAVLDRLRRGERWWAAECVMRAAGLLLLVACGLLWRCTCRFAAQPATPLECAFAALAFACLSAGIALFVEGPGLLRPVPVPPRAWLP